MKGVLSLGLASFLFCLFLSAPAIQAVSVGGAEFSERRRVGDSNTTLRGSALLKKMMFVKVYAGAFYLEEGAPAAEALGDVPKALVLHYFRSISAADLAKATRVMMEKNTSPDQFEALLPKIERMNSLYRDVEPGDRYTAVYIPADGTTLFFNGNPLGTVEGSAFSRAYFAIWIGENPIDEGFRNSLLGKS
jgi:hypothetical protein